ncbi:TraM recognition domain-containing protein [Sphingobium sp. MK2]|uniref:type IV secretory system conjugative DNA transfer family protein n=1 Tax=Sphingobium sp. MK2 TaxID=3116540 RepID=UPI0032E35B84
MGRKRLSLDGALLRLSRFSTWTIRHALSHILILGTTGSGKSSTTFKQVIIAMLRAGFGMLLCTVKEEDAREYKKYCMEAGRCASLFIWRVGAAVLDFIAWELARSGNINNVVDVVGEIIEIALSCSPSRGKSGDEFWLSARQAHLRYTIPPLFAAYGRVRITDILAFLRSAPKSLEQMRDPEWQKTSFWWQTFIKAAERLKQGPIPGFDEAAAQRCAEYWNEFISLDSKTSSNITITLTTALSRFEQGILSELFCGETTIVPEILFHQAIVILDFPVQSYGEDGAIAQKAIKYLVQRASLGRHGMDARQGVHPLGIGMDEAQVMLYHRDAEFMARCRSSLVSVVMATQSLPALRVACGGDNAHDRADNLVSNFNTIVVHSSGCATTNRWMADKIGRSLQRRGGYSQNHGTNSSHGVSLSEGDNWGVNSNSGGSTSHNSGAGGSSYGGGSSWGSGSSHGGSDSYGRNRSTGSSQGESWSVNETMDHTIEAGWFGTGLRTGGDAFGGRVDALWYQSGRIFPETATNFLQVEYQQK